MSALLYVYWRNLFPQISEVSFIQIHSVNKYLLSIYYVAGTFRATVEYKSEPNGYKNLCSWIADILEEGYRQP